MLSFLYFLGAAVAMCDVPDNYQHHPPYCLLPPSVFLLMMNWLEQFLLKDKKQKKRKLPISWLQRELWDYNYILEMTLVNMWI